MISNPLFDSRFSKEVARRIELERKATDGLTEDYVSRLQKQASMAPFLSPRTLMNTANSDIDDETLSLMNYGAKEVAQLSRGANIVLDKTRLFNNPVVDAVGETISFAFKGPYDQLKTTSKYLTALGASSTSFANNYLLERGISNQERVERLGKLLASPALLFFDEDMKQAAKYTELGALIRKRDQESSGFFMSAQQQYEQMLEVMGINPDGGELDYKGRLYFDDAFVKAPIPELYGQPQLMKQPATVGAFITAVPRTIRPDGAITSIRGLNPDSVAGSLISGTIDGFTSVVSDLSAGAITAVRTGLRVAKGAQIAKLVSPERLDAVPGSSAVAKFLQLGKTANDLPSTTKSWSEIQQAKSQYAEDAAKIRSLQASKAINKKEAEDMLSLRDEVLKEAEYDVWNKDALSEMIRTDTRFADIFNMIESSKVIKNVDERANIIRNRIFRNEVSLEFAGELAQETSVEGYRSVFLRAADGLAMGETVLPEKITSFGGVTRRLLDKTTAGKINTGNLDRYVSPPDVAFGATQRSVGQTMNTGYLRYAPGTQKIIDEVSDPLKNLPDQRIGVAKSSYEWSKDRFRHLFRVAPKVEIMINGNAGQRADAVDNFYAWSKNLFQSSSDDPYLQEVMGRVTAAMTNKPRTIERLRGNKLVTETITGPASRAGLKAVEEISYEVMERYMIKQNLDRGQIRDIIKGIRANRANSRTYAVANGLPTDYGQLQRLANDGLIDLKGIANDMAKELGVPVSAKDLEVIGPAAIQEVYNNVLTLPDWRMLKSIVEKPALGNLIRNPKTGQLRLAPNAADVVINDIWKPATLANLGYFARNILEGNFRLFLAGPDAPANLFNRPLLYWKIVRNKAGVMDLMGKTMTKKEIDELSARVFETLTPSEKNLLSVTSASSWGYSRANLDSLSNLVKTGQVDLINKASTSAYTMAALDAVRKVNSDPLEALLSRISHLDQRRQVDAALEYLYKSDEGAHVQSRFLEMVQDYGLTVGAGSRIGEYPIGAQTLAKLALDTPKQRKAFFRGLIQTQIQGRVEKMSQVMELRPLVGQNAIPLLGENGRAVVSTQRVTQAFRDNVEKFAWGKKPLDENMIGGIFYNNGTEQAFYIDDIIRSGPKGGVLTAKLVELVTTPANLKSKRKFDHVTGWMPQKDGYGADAEALIRTVLKATDKKSIDAFPAILPTFSRQAKNMSDLRAGWRGLVDGVFSGAMGRGVNALEKLPAFRQYKWSIYEDYYESLSGVAINDAVRTITTKAKETGMSPDDFMGGIKGRFKKLKDLQGKTDALKAGYGIEEMDRFASSLAEKRMRELFYDMPQKLNFETATGVSLLFQFIAAQRVIFTDLAKLSIKNPERIYRTARAFNGAMDMNLPGDTQRALIYTHPVTGKYVFRHPLGMLPLNYILKNGLGVDLGDTTPILESNVQGLNIGLVGVPQANPVGQVVISGVLNIAQKFAGGNNEGIEEIRKMFLPFESFQSQKSIVDRLTPTFFYKLISGIRAMSTGARTDAVIREVADAGAALSLTGNYDLNTVEGLKRLDDDAAKLGIFMYLAGGLSTFSGPASGSPDYIVNLEGIDVHSASLAAALQEMRDQDPDGAALRWIETFGEEALIYLAGKTQMSKDARGIVYTPEYLMWRKNNVNTIDKYPGSVANFFGPPENESEFEFALRTMLLNEGRSRYASISDRVLAAQYVRASSYYRAIRNKLPVYLNDQQEEQLKIIREDLSKRYRGFTAIKYSTEDFETNIKSIRMILKEGSFADSELVEPLREYMIYRDAFQAQLKLMGYSSFRSKKAAPFRVQLDSIGESIARKNLSFRRLYDNLLSSETNPAGIE
jgi:hypothetical protein